MIRSRRPTPLSILVICLVAAGCSTGSSTSLPEEYRGRWEYLGSSGGITGQGMGDPATGSIVITADNTIERRSEDGSLESTTDFELGRGTSIFGPEEVWILSTSSGLDQVIRLHEGDTLTLSDNVYDGFQFTYARTR